MRQDGDGHLLRGFHAVAGQKLHLGHGAAGLARDAGPGGWPINVLSIQLHLHLAQTLTCL